MDRFDGQINVWIKRLNDPSLKKDWMMIVMLIQN